jgi:DNA-binding beta-propeller fold protein YncE
MLDFWRDQKAVIYTGFVIALLVVLFLIFTQKPTGILDHRLAGNKDKVVMATEAPDYIEIYSPATMRYKIHPSDERMNDMKIDKKGERVFVANKEGWLNIFYISGRKAPKVRRKLGDVLQGVALSGDERFLAVGIGSQEDYNARIVHLYSVADLENRNLFRPVPFAEIPSRGDIQAIVANPDPENNRGYIISSQDDKMAIFDFASGRSVGFVELGNSPAMFRCQPSGEKAYGSINARQSLIVVDLMKENEKNLGYIKLPSAPYYLAFNADGTHLYAGSRGLNEVYLVDTVKDELIETLTLSNPLAQVQLTTEIIAVSTDEKYLYMIPQYEFLIVYEINHDGLPLEPLQTKNFPKVPSIMDVIRPL